MILVTFQYSLNCSSTEFFSNIRLYIDENINEVIFYLNRFRKEDLGKAIISIQISSASPIFVPFVVSHPVYQKQQQITISFKFKYLCQFITLIVTMQCLLKLNLFFCSLILFINFFLCLRFQNMQRSKAFDAYLWTNS